MRVAPMNLSETHAQQHSAFPDATSVVLAARNDSVTLIIERRREYFVSVPFEHLQAIATIDIPHTARPVGRRGNDFVCLRVERHL